MDQNRKIVVFLGAAATAAVVLRLVLGPIPVAGPGAIYAVSKTPPAAQLAVRDSDRPLFPD